MRRPRSRGPTLGLRIGGRRSLSCAEHWTGPVHVPTAAWQVLAGHFGPGRVPPDSSTQPCRRRPVACRWVNCGALRRSSLSSGPASRGAGDASPLTGRRPRPSAGSGALHSDARGAFKESPDGCKRGTEPRARRHDGETSLRRSVREGRGHCHPRGQRDGGAGGGGSRPARTGEASGREDTAGFRYGMGYGLRATPAGVYVIRGRDVEWQPPVDLNCLALQRAVVALWSSGRSRRHSRAAD